MKVAVTLITKYKKNWPFQQ